MEDGGLEVQDCPYVRINPSSKSRPTFEARCSRSMPSVDQSQWHIYWQAEAIQMSPGISLLFFQNFSSTRRSLQNNRTETTEGNGGYSMRSCKLGASCAVLTPFLLLYKCKIYIQPGVGIGSSFQSIASQEIDASKISLSFVAVLAAISPS